MKKFFVSLCAAALLLAPAVSFCAVDTPAQQPGVPAKAASQQPAKAPAKTATQPSATPAKTTDSYNKAVSGIRHGNKQTRIFHNSGCRYYNSKNCTEQFSNAQQAISKGYTPCKRCGG